MGFYRPDAFSSSIARQLENNGTFNEEPAFVVGKSDLKPELQLHITQGSMCRDCLHPCVYFHSIRLGRYNAAWASPPPHPRPPPPPDVEAQMGKMNMCNSVFIRSLSPPPSNHSRHNWKRNCSHSLQLLRNWWLGSLGQ